VFAAATSLTGIPRRPLPVPDQDRLVVSWRVLPSGPADQRELTVAPAMPTARVTTPVA
jgi:hypothetical protein